MPSEFFVLLFGGMPMLLFSDYLAFIAYAVVVHFLLLQSEFEFPFSYAVIMVIYAYSLVYRGVMVNEKY